MVQVEVDPVDSDDFVVDDDEIDSDEDYVRWVLDNGYIRNLKIRGFKFENV